MHVEYLVLACRACHGAGAAGSLLGTMHSGAKWQVAFPCWTEEALAWPPETGRSSWSLCASIEACLNTTMRDGSKARYRIRAEGLVWWLKCVDANANGRSNQIGSRTCPGAAHRALAVSTIACHMEVAVVVLIADTELPYRVAVSLRTPSGGRKRGLTSSVAIRSTNGAEPAACGL